MNDYACRDADVWAARQWHDALGAFLTEHRLCRHGLDDPHITDTVVALWSACGARATVVLPRQATGSR